MRKHGGTPSRRGAFLRLAATSPPGVAPGHFVGGLAGCKPPRLFKRRASSFAVTGAMPGGTMGRLSTTECTDLPTFPSVYSRTRLALIHSCI